MPVPFNPYFCHLIVTSLSYPRPLRATLQASCYRVLRGLRLENDDPNAPPLIFGGVFEEGTYPLARCLLRAGMIEEIVRSHSPNKVLMATLLPIDQAEQLLPLSYRSALAHLSSGYCLRL